MWCRAEQRQSSTRLKTVEIHQYVESGYKAYAAGWQGRLTFGRELMRFTPGLVEMTLYREMRAKCSTLVVADRLERACCLHRRTGLVDLRKGLWLPLGIRRLVNSRRYSFLRESSFFHRLSKQYARLQSASSSVVELLLSCLNQNPFEGSWIQHKRSLVQSRVLFPARHDPTDAD